MLAQASIIKPMKKDLSETTKQNQKQAGALFDEFLRKHCDCSLPEVGAVTPEVRQKICTVERFEQFAQFLYAIPKKDSDSFYTYLSALQHLSGAKQAVEKIFGHRCVEKNDPQKCEEAKQKQTKYGTSEEAWYAQL